MIPTDFLGREIRPGDHVVYPQRKSSTLWVNYAEVLDIVPSTDRGQDTINLKVKILKSSYRYASAGIDRITTIKVLNRVVVVDA